MPSKKFVKLIRSIIAFPPGRAERTDTDSRNKCVKTNSPVGLTYEVIPEELEPLIQQADEEDANHGAHQTA
jgi:hypothetical protein